MNIHPTYQCSLRYHVETEHNRIEPLHESDSSYLRLGLLS